MTGPRPAVGRVSDIRLSMAQSLVTRALGFHELLSLRLSVVLSEAGAEQWLPWVGLGRPSWGTNGQ
jgi:hypothetical protein